MSPHDDRRKRGPLGPWLPLIATVSVAALGFAAWVWSERNDDDEENEDTPHPRRRHDDPSQPPPRYPGDTAYNSARGAADDGYMSRMSGALRRTPSPQQFLEGATRTVSAGITAAGAAVGNVLGSIKEEDKAAYKEHNAWEEEAEARKRPEASRSVVSPETAKSAVSRAAPSATRGKKLKVAVVVSADADLDGVDDGLDYSQTHASILSYIPQDTDFTRIQLFVLIFSPDLKRHPLDTTSGKPSASLSSSYSNIQTPVDEAEKSLELSPDTPAFNALWTEAEDIVETKTMIFPFTTQTGHLNILRHINPDIIYLQEALSGKEKQGSVITQLQTWLRGDIVVVVGGDHGDGGLADSDSELEESSKPKDEKWWEKEERVGKGRHVFVVENVNTGDDWARRVEGTD